MKIRINKNTLACAFWTVSMMAYMFQCYQRELATLIVPCLATFLLLESNHMKFQSYRSWMPLYCFFFFYLTISGIISYINGSSIGSMLRFYLILLAIPLAQCVREPNFHAEWIVLKILAVVKAYSFAYMDRCFHQTGLSILPYVGKKYGGGRYLYFKRHTASTNFRNKYICDTVYL